jgi:probable rRNA maturation factor
VTITAQTGREYVPFLRRYVPRAFNLLNRPAKGLPLGDLSIALIGDAKMSELHREFMSIDGPTDVLAFPLDQDARGAAISGEVVVCVPYARRIAKTRKMDPEREVLLYAIHGLLHLLGYDDTTPAAYRAMHRTEDELLTKLGLGPVFAEVSRGKQPKSR